MLTYGRLKFKGKRHPRESVVGGDRLGAAFRRNHEEVRNGEGRGEVDRGTARRCYGFEERRVLACKLPVPRGKAKVGAYRHREAPITQKVGERRRATARFHTKRVIASQEDPEFDVKERRRTKGGRNRAVRHDRKVDTTRFKVLPDGARAVVMLDHEVRSLLGRTCEEVGQEGRRDETARSDAEPPAGRLRVEFRRRKETVRLLERATELGENAPERVRRLQAPGVRCE